MRSLLTVGLLLVLAGGAGGGAPIAAESENGQESRAFTIRHKDLDDVVARIRPALSNDSSVLIHHRSNTITVTDAVEILDEVTLLVTDFDRPPLDVALNINLVKGTRRPPGRPASLTVPRLPPSLRELTRWLDYTLLGGMAILTSEAEESTLMLGEEYRIHFQVAMVDERAGRVRLKDFSLERRVRRGDGEEYVPIFDTVVNLKSGTPYVFGATRGDVSQRALFLTITANIAP